ncbi:MAG: tryptophan--tRNA ligase, partial [Pseudomonadota bacterium]
FVADWHALTTQYDAPEQIPQHTRDMLIDWLAAGINPHEATMFVQSQVPEHAELHLLLSMITPLGWLERVPSYKDQQQKLHEKDLTTYGFLGYPLLQSADILLYRASFVPVGEDQVAHVELTREVARRFNHIYGRDDDFVSKAEQAIRKLGRKNAGLYRHYRKAYQEQGDTEALSTAQALLNHQQHLSLTERERLLGYLEGGGKLILPEPQPLLTRAPKMPGLDGQKMSKSYANTISLDATPDTVSQKIRTMPTDPARVRRHDPGDPQQCPVWPFHEIYSDAATCDWVQQGCRSAGIGCVECKQPIIDAMVQELAPIQARAAEYTAQPELIQNILHDGCQRAREVAHETMADVRHAMALS